MNVIELEFDSIRDAEFFESKHGYPILFKDVDCEVYLAVWVGSKEKKAILSLLEDKNAFFAKVPIKFRVFPIILNWLGVVASRVVISSIHKEVYQAKAIFLTGKGEDALQFALRGRFADLMFLAMRFNPRYFVNVEVIKSSGTVRDEQEIDIAINMETSVTAELYAQVLKEKVSNYYPIGSGFLLNIPELISMKDAIIQLFKHKLN